MNKLTFRKKTIFTKVLISLWMIIFIVAQLYSQTNENNETIQLKEVKKTQLKLEASGLDNDLIFLKEKKIRNRQDLFDEGINFGIKSDRVQPIISSSSVNEYDNAFYLLVGSGYYFAGGIDYKNYFEKSLLKINLNTLIRNKILPLKSKLQEVENSRKIRIDMSIEYILGSNHKLVFNHNSYLLGLQKYQPQTINTTNQNSTNSTINNNNKDLFLYDFNLSHDGYYRFNSWLLQNYFSFGGGKYGVRKSLGSVYLEFDTRLKINIMDSKAEGIYTDLVSRLTWLENVNSFRFIIGGSIGYSWEVTSKLLLELGLGHTSFIHAGNIKTNIIDRSSPIFSKSKIKILYQFDNDIVLSLVNQLKTESPKIRDFYIVESIVDYTIFPNQNNLFESTFIFLYNQKNILNGIKLESKLFYKFYFRFDRLSYQVNQLKKIYTENDIHKAGLDLFINISFLNWINLHQQTIYQQSLNNKQFFPFMKFKSGLTFSFSSIFSKIFFTHLLTLKDYLYDPEKKNRWSTSYHLFNIAYSFEYKNIIIGVAVENLLNYQYSLQIPFMISEGRNIKSNITYKF